MLSLQKATLSPLNITQGCLKATSVIRKNSLLRFVDQHKRSSFYFLAGKKESKMASRKDKSPALKQGEKRQDRPWTTSQKPYFRCLHSTSACAKPPSRIHISLKSPKYKKPFKRPMLSQTPAGLVA